MAVRQLDHRVATEDRLGRREVELGQVEIGTPGVQAHKEVVASGAHPAARFSYEVIIGCGDAPRGALFRGQSAPAAGDSANVVAMALLLRGLRIARAHVLARDLAVTGVEIDDGALPARLWNGAELHVARDSNRRPQRQRSSLLLRSPMIHEPLAGLPRML